MKKLKYRSEYNEYMSDDQFYKNKQNAINAVSHLVGLILYLLAWGIIGGCVVSVVTWFIR